ncbi:uncharacterized protein [Typha angustifolia]|uniref:uncharacterized protein n=1 Tax=Typha angustifolia TaxID=59011 RepID=UPI003C30A61B
MEEPSEAEVHKMEEREVARSSSEQEKAAAMKVVVAVDESDGSFYALTWTIDHLFKLKTRTDQVVLVPNRNLVILHAQHAVENFVYPVAGHGTPFGSIYATSSVVDSIRKSQEQNTKNVISRAMQVCQEREVTADAAVVDGDTKDAICQAVEQMQADLLVVGSRGLGKIKRALLGSVSDYVAHHARCPVLIVKPPRSDQQ